MHCNSSLHIMLIKICSSARRRDSNNGLDVQSSYEYVEISILFYSNYNSPYPILYCFTSTSFSHFIGPMPSMFQWKFINSYLKLEWYAGWSVPWYCPPINLPNGELSCLHWTLGRRIAMSICLLSFLVLHTYNASKSFKLYQIFNASYLSHDINIFNSK